MCENPARTFLCTQVVITVQVTVEVAPSTRPFKNNIGITFLMAS